jgi:hypothetical protein
MIFYDQILDPGEYLTDIVKKDTVYIHQTAGSHRPDWTIDGWERDRTKSGERLPVATAYVIGGKSVKDGNVDFDGKIYRAFDDKYWAYHLGLKTANNVELNKKSIGIEICNYGPLTKTKDGTFINYVNNSVPASMVETLPQPWKGYTHFHKYTDKQLSSVKALLLDIASRHKIDLKAGLHQFITSGVNSFSLNQGALKGLPGLWTHVNVREDKSDCWPQPQLIDLIKTL